MHKKASHYRCMRSEVAGIKHNSPPVGQILGCKLFTTDGAIVDSTGPSKKFVYRGAAHDLRFIVNPTKAFLAVNSDLETVCRDLLFIISQQPPHEWVDYVTKKQRFADRNSVHGFFLSLAHLTPIYQILCVFCFFQVVQN